MTYYEILKKCSVQMMGIEERVIHLVWWGKLKNIRATGKKREYDLYRVNYIKLQGIKENYIMSNWVHE